MTVNRRTAANLRKKSNPLGEFEVFTRMDTGSLQNVIDHEKTVQKAEDALSEVRRIQSSLTETGMRRVDGIIKDLQEKIVNNPEVKSDVYKEKARKIISGLQELKTR